MSIGIGVSGATLKSELISDPAGLGYLAGVSGRIRDDDNCAVLINTARSGVAADGLNYSIFRNDITPREVINAIIPVDFTNMTQIQLSKMNLLFQSAPLDATSSGVRQNFQNVFSGTSTLLSGNLAGIASRNSSRAAVLFGYGTTVSDTDVGSALNH